MNKKNYEELVRKANEANQAYYEKQPIISDEEYDALIEEIEAIEHQTGVISPDSPSHHVGAAVSDGNKVKHSHPLLSIPLKAKHMEEAFNWCKSMKHLGSNTIIIEPKLDGITVNLIYEQGKLVQAVTRGNGYEGLDITDKVKQMSTVPQSVGWEADFEVRGEAVIPYSDFLSNPKLQGMSNPRNAVSGIMNMKEAINPDDYSIHIICYDLFMANGNEPSRHDAKNVEHLTMLWFETVPFFSFRGEVDFSSFIERVKASMIKEKDGFNTLAMACGVGNEDTLLDAVCDGLVFKVGALPIRDQIGMTEKGPKWAMALKFKPLAMDTEIQSVDWQVGKTGKITPVANFKPIQIGGTLISRATMNNLSYLKYGDYSLCVGDTIKVERSNDVIPHIASLVSKNGGKVIEAPTKCPCCGGAVKIINDQLYCVNDNCSAKFKAKLEHYASRDAMNIDGMGEMVIESLVNKGYVKTFEDLYSLTQEKLLTLEGFSNKKSSNLLSAIEKSKKCEFWQFLYSLSIPGVGKQASKDLANHFGDLATLLKATSDVASVDGIGVITSDAICSYLAKNKDSVLRLANKLGINTTTTEAKSSKYKGLTFVITGTLEHPRDYYVKQIELEGGKVSGSVSKKTSYLLCGEDAGSKLAKAKELGIPVIKSLKEVA